MAASKIGEKLMGEDLQHIDALFKQGLGDAKLSPPNGLFEQCVEKLNQSMPTNTAASSSTTWWSVALKSPLAWLGVAAVTTVVGYFLMDQDMTANKKNLKLATTKAEVSKDSEHASLKASTPVEIQNDGGATVNGTSNIVLPQKDNAVVSGAQGAMATKVSEGGSDAVTAQKQEAVPSGQKTNKVQNADAKYKPCKEVLGEWRPVITENIGGLVTLELSGRYGNLQIHWGDGEKSILNGSADNTINQVSHAYLVAQKKGFIVKMVNVMADSESGASCADSQRLSMLVLPANEVTAVFVPDVFTPNSDGKNDVFFVEMSKPLQFDITILDVNNRTVFRSNDYQATWSGTYMNTECKEDVYRVIVSYKYSGDKDWKYIRKQIKLIRN
jgi:gliding motility-associated-like protein